MLCENVYKTFTHKWNTPDSSHWVRSYDNHLLCTLSHTNLLPTVGYLCFLFVASSSKNLKAFLMFEALSVTFMCTHGNTVSTSTISVPEAVNEHSYYPTPYPASSCLFARRIVSPVCFTSPNGTALNSISTMTYFPSTYMIAWRWFQVEKYSPPC